MEDRSFENRQVAIRLESADLAVAPGDSVTVPLHRAQSQRKRWLL